MSARPVLTPSTVLSIRERVAKGERQKDIAQTVGVHRSMVGKIAQGLKWKYVGGPRTDRSMRNAIQRCKYASLDRV
jgi:DNA-binding XRE family transcriptional regulator